MKLIALFGTGRNGSTLISRLLDGMPEVYVHPVECNFLCAMNDLAILPVVTRRTQQNAIRGRLTRLNSSIPTKRLLRYFRAHMSEIKSDYLPQVELDHLGQEPDAVLAREAPAFTPADFVPRFLAANAAWVEPGRAPASALFKTTEAPYVAAYEQVFPDMRFIHIIRNPVDMWASAKRSMANYKKLPPWYLGLDTLRTMMECRWVPHASALAARRNDARHLVVRYEDLILNPHKVVGDLCAWLNTPPPPEPDTQTLLGGRHPKEMFKNPSQKGVDAPRKVVADLSSRFAYDPVVTEREREFITLRSGALAREFGYLLEEPRVNGRALAGRWVAIDEWDFANVRGLKSRLLSIASFMLRRAYVWRHCLAK